MKNTVFTSSLHHWKHTSSRILDLAPKYLNKIIFSGKTNRQPVYPWWFSGWKIRSACSNKRRALYHIQSIVRSFPWWVILSSKLKACTTNSRPVTISIQTWENSFVSMLILLCQLYWSSWFSVVERLLWILTSRGISSYNESLIPVNSYP